MQREPTGVGLFQCSGPPSVKPQATSAESTKVKAIKAVKHAETILEVKCILPAHGGQEMAFLYMVINHSTLNRATNSLQEQAMGLVMDQLHPAYQ